MTRWLNNASSLLGNKWARERTGANEGDTQALPLPSRVSLARAGPFFLAPMYFLSAYCATLTVGARDFSSAISGFLPSLCSDPLPWVPEVVSRVRPGASSAAARLDTSGEATRKNL